MSDRTLRITDPFMEGDDVRGWQSWLNDKLDYWNVNLRLVEDGSYGYLSRSTTASIAYGMGYETSMLAEGITPEIRIKMRNAVRTAEENQAHEARADWLDRFRDRYNPGDLHTPMAHILQDSWGWHPGVHDGVDLICPPSEPLLAICDGEIIRADAGGWWGLGAPSDPALRAKGDGIIILRSTTNQGMFDPGLNFCYGHAEGAVVRDGQTVKAGQHIGQAGYARAWHSHFMVNGNPNDRGVGDRDPLPYVRYAQANS
jgi:murein DD-endopeptidase MepM/ murein hydrolase activator NlpD